MYAQFPHGRDILLAVIHKIIRLAKPLKEIGLVRVVQWGRGIETGRYDPETADVVPEMAKYPFRRRSRASQRTGGQRDMAVPLAVGPKPFQNSGVGREM